MYFEKLTDEQIKEIIVQHPAVARWASAISIGLITKSYSGNNLMVKYRMPGGDSVAYRIVISDFEVDASDFVFKNRLFEPSNYLEPTAAICNEFNEQNQVYRKYMASQFEGYSEDCTLFILDQANKRVSELNRLNEKV